MTPERLQQIAAEIDAVLRRHNVRIEIDRDNVSIAEDFKPIEFEYYEEEKIPPEVAAVCTCDRSRLAVRIGSTMHFQECPVVAPTGKICTILEVREDRVEKRTTRYEKGHEAFHGLAKLPIARPCFRITLRLVEPEDTCPATPRNT